jgi:hypothetical protein
MTGPPIAAGVDPAAFVAEAERITNDRDLAAIPAVYAAGAVFEVISDGVHEIHRGADEILAAWRVYFDVLRRGDFRLRKQLAAADAATICNRWEGTLGRGRARGIEIWRLDSAGRVEEHHMYTFLDVRPADSLRAQLRALISQPRAAAAFLMARPRRGRG